MSVEKIQKVAVWAWMKVPLSVLLLSVFLLVWFPYLSIWEGAIFPVTSKVTIEESAKQKDGTWVVTMSFMKYRPCEFESLTFYWKDEGGRLQRVPWENVPEEDVRSSIDPSRLVGKNVVTLRLLTMVGEDRWQAHVRHSCHPFYSTRTELYP
jgi:hypothetical protein